MFYCDGDKWMTGGAKRVNCGVEAGGKKGHVLPNEN
jgi:hypothetical protein